MGLTLDPHRLCRVQITCFLSPGFLICTTGIISLGSQAALGTKVPSRCSVNTPDVREMASYPADCNLFLKKERAVLVFV